MARLERTVSNEDKNNPGVTKYYDDGTSEFTPSSAATADVIAGVPREERNVGGENTEGLTYFNKDSSGNSPINPLTGRAYVAADINPATGQPYTQSGYSGYVAPDSSAPYKAPAPDKAAIRRDKLDNVQSVVDAITSQYNTLVNNEKIVGLNRNKRVRALNVNSFLGGSNIGSSNAQTMENYNAKVIANLESEKGAKINAILNDVAAETDQVYEERRKEFIKAADDELAAQKKFKDEAKTTAENRVANLASAGISLDELEKSDPDVYKNLLRDSGLSDIELDALWNSKSKSASKFEYKELKDGTLLRISSDGTTKEMGKYKAPDDTGNWDLESMSDGTLYWTKKDPNGKRLEIKEFKSGTDKEGFELGQGQARYEYNPTTKQFERVGYNPKTSSGSPSGSIKAEQEKDAMDMNSELSTVAGSDGFVSPDNYALAKKTWVSSGYSPEDFDKRFAGFRNPTNKGYSVGGAAAEKEVSDKEKATAAAAAKAEADSKKEKTLEQNLSAKKADGLSKGEIEKWLKKEYGSVPKSAKTWLKNNY